MNLKSLQEKIKRLEEKKGWLETPDEKMTFLFEELGEVAKWVRKARKKPLSQKQKELLNFELADVLQHLISLANHFGLDLAKGLRKKR